MSISNEYLQYILDQLSCVGDVTSKKMFGGAGIYLNGIMFALIADDVSYLKVDDTNRMDFENAESEAFKPFPHKKMVMPYYEIPLDILEDTSQLKEWAEKAYQVALTKK